MEKRKMQHIRTLGIFAVVLAVSAIAMIGNASAGVSPTYPPSPPPPPPPTSTPTPSPTPTPTPIPEFPAYSLLIAASSMIALAFVISRRKK